MQFWFSPNREVSLPRQLETQVVLAIVSGALRPGDRLPSTRELARRFALHPNTISAGYRLLETGGWTEHRRGGAVCVRGPDAAPQSATQVLDGAIAEFFRLARELNLPMAEVRARVNDWLAAPPPSRFVLVDPDRELRRILLVEIAALTRAPVRAVWPAEGRLQNTMRGAIALCRPSQERATRRLLPAGVELLPLPIRGAADDLASRAMLARGRLIGVVSRWSEFRERARTMLLAAGVDGDALLVRDAGRAGWSRGLEKADAIVCDAYAATLPSMPAAQRIVFRLLDDGAQKLLDRVLPGSSGV